MKVCVAQVDILKTMTPMQFNAFRGYLSSSSGFQSAQFRKVEAILGRRDERMASHLPPNVLSEIAPIASRNLIWDSFLDYLAKRGYVIPLDVLQRDKKIAYQSNIAVQDSLLKVHQSDPESAMVAERLVDIDEGMQEWSYRHVKMVERTIGHEMGSGGSSGVEYVASTLFSPVFKDQWEIRSKF
jgi:tryptophan 2,3-dioxygenase